MSEENTATNDSLLNLSNVDADAQDDLDTDIAQDGDAEDGGDKLWAGKYKSIEDLENGYKEAVKKLTEKRPTAPDEYAFVFDNNETLKDVQINLDDDPTYQKMIPLFKEMNLSQEQAQQLVETYLETTYEAMPDPGDELQKLGPEGNDIIKRVESFVAKNFTEDEQQIASAIATTAAGVKFLDKVYRMRGEKPIPTNASEFGSAKTYQELQAEAMKLRTETPNFDLDKKAQARYEALMDAAVKLQLAGKK